MNYEQIRNEIRPYTMKQTIRLQQGKKFVIPVDMYPRTNEQLIEIANEYIAIDHNGNIMQPTVQRLKYLSVCYTDPDWIG